MKYATKRLYMERKRLILAAALAFLAGYISFIRADQYIGGVHISLIVGAIYSVVITLFALAVCIFLPKLRFMIESVAISRLLFSLYVFAMPEIGYKIMASPILNALLVVGGGFLISRLIHGRIIRETRKKGWRNFILPYQPFKRVPVHVVGADWQHRFVNWVDDAAPFRV